MVRINISFKDSEKHLSDYLKSKRSPSNYVKDLIEADMIKNEKVNKNEIKN